MLPSISGLGRALGLAGSLLVPLGAQATWSIAALNPHTGTIAVAGASCSYLVYGIAQVLPGKGLVIVQAESNELARTTAAKLLDEEVPLETVLSRITVPGNPFQPERQQIALLSFKAIDKPLGYTGSAVEGAKGIVSGSGFIAQANTMVSDAVLQDVAREIRRGSPWSDDLRMAGTLMRALNAGALAGGDSRCKGSNSSTAFISLYKKSDPVNVPWLTLTIFGLEAGQQSALPPLQRLFQQWLQHDTGNPSTRSFIVPAAP